MGKEWVKVDQVKVGLERVKVEDEVVRMWGDGVLPAREYPF